jgi:ABC-type nitrate/sulfonate/bicarbonate transport system permease component
MSGTLAILFARRALTITAVVFALGLLWQIAVTGFGVPPYIVPRPVAVLDAFANGWWRIARHAGFTLSAAALGLLSSTLLASAIAISFSLRPTLEQASMPLVLIFRSTPVAAVAPIMTLMIGRGISTSIAVVTIIAFFPILVNLMRGIAATDPNAAELLHVYGATPMQQMRLVRLRFALPYLFTGLRISSTSALLGAMLSEWITGSEGLGKMILDSSEMRETELLWATVLTSVALGLCVFWTTSAAEHRLLRWKT